MTTITVSWKYSVKQVCSFITLSLIIPFALKAEDTTPSESTTVMETISAIDAGLVSPYLLPSLVSSEVIWTNEFSFEPLPLPPDSIIYPLKERTGDFVSGGNNKNPFDLKDPAGIEREVVYDPETNTYIITEKVGGQDIRYPTVMSFEEYWEYKKANIEAGNWSSNTSLSSPVKGVGLQPKLSLSMDDIRKDLGLGLGEIQITPTGNIQLRLGFRGQVINNPGLQTFGRPQFSPDFWVGINAGVVGKIGDKLKVNTNYNTEAQFNFDNQIKLEYVGNEDEIIQELRAGDIQFPLPTQLIPGSQSLFGAQAKLKFGRLTINNVISQQQSRSKRISVQNGGQQQEFEVQASRYDENRHFFLSHYFRDNFEPAVKDYPFINSPVIIQRLEVYINDTRTRPQDQQRDIVALTDLGEGKAEHLTNSSIIPLGSDFPKNNANNLYAKLNKDETAKKLQTVSYSLETQHGLRDVRDFKKTSARLLRTDEYTFDPQLGYISLNFALRPNEVLGVAYEYVDIYGNVYKVGQFSEEVTAADSKQDPQVLLVKMLKTSTRFVKLPMWKLMMKNVYALGAFQVEERDFLLNVFYENPTGAAVPYLPEANGIQGRPLIKVFNLDRLNRNGEPYADGIFDFYETQRDTLAQSLQSNTTQFGTINRRNGRLIFPVLQPFGDHLENVLRENNNSEEIIQRYVYDELYDSTRIIAAEFPEFDRFVIKGTYKSNISSEISLNAFNVPRGSVVVMVGARRLQEGVDYEVNYGLGKVIILNDAYLTSGQQIHVDYEDNATFGLLQKTYLGSRMDYWINDDFTLGATLVRLSERPYTQKVNFGDDPIANAMAGVDMSFFRDAPGLTRFLDKIPGLDTKEPSSISFNAEGAAFLPGHSRLVNVVENEDGTVYIDDFEGANTPYPLHTNWAEWSLASTPRRNDNRYEESILTNDVSYGFNRAQMSWYFIDFIFGNGNSGAGRDRDGELLLTPDVASTEASCWPYSRQVFENELFPQAQSELRRNLLRTFDVSYYPDERGPYNFDVNPTQYSAGVAEDGKLLDPKSRWGGIMRECPHKDFEQVNVEFIEFWVLDPFMYYDGSQQDGKYGELYLNLGNVSEDILKDSRQFFEQTLPSADEIPSTVETDWGIVSKKRPVANAFDNDENTRRNQDIGFDGLADRDERVFFANYLDELKGAVSEEAFEEVNEDPAGDNHQSFLDIRYNDLIDEFPDAVPGENILRRYKKFNGPDGNSPVQDSGYDPRNLGASNFPDKEDLNRDNALNDTESYFEYKIAFKDREEMRIGENYLAGWVDIDNYGDNDCQQINNRQERWYYFRVPVDQHTDVVGDINFRNIEFIRMYMTEFEHPVTMRFAKMNMVRNNWRKYQSVIRQEGEYSPANSDNVQDAFFNVSAMSFQEHGSRLPFPYVLPPGINRETIPGGTATLIQQDERAISVQVGNLPDGEAKGIYNRVNNLDMRQYEQLKLFIHAEALTKGEIVEPLEDGEVTAFIRIGDDFKNNYYEYEIPLVLTRDNDPDYNLNDTRERQAWIWSYFNEMHIPLQDLVDIKLERNFQKTAFPLDKPFVKYVPRKRKDDKGELQVLTNEGQDLVAKITVVGSPDLGKVKQVMMGVRNPKQTYQTKNNNADDGRTKSVEVWFNELRLTDFDEDPGYAALANLDIKLADLGNLNFSANMHTTNFGTLEQKVNDRFRDNYFEFGASTNLELSKFLPENSGVRLPLYAAITQSISNPEYDPFDSDVTLKEKVSRIEEFEGNEVQEGGSEAAKEYRRKSQTVSTRKSVNFTDVRKERTNPERKPMPYDIENLSLTYAYDEEDLRDPIIEKYNVKRHTASLGYSYNARPKYWEPFKKIKSKSLYLRWLKEFNFNLVPNTISIRNDVYRRAGLLQLRADEGIDPNELISYDRSLTWERRYNFLYRPMKSISVNFNATNKSVVDENPNLPASWESIRDTLGNVGIGGRTKTYNHNLSLSYILPLDKIPLLSWTKLSTSYNSTYNWDNTYSRILAAQYGNNINNTQNYTLDGELDFEKLYNNIPFLKKVNAKPRRKPPPRKKNEKDKGTPPPTPNKKERKEGEIDPMVKAFVRPLLMLRKAELTYRVGNSTALPGYMPSSHWLGSNWNTADTPVPGTDFIFGAQPQLRGWLEWAAAQGILTDTSSLNAQVQQSVNNRVQGNIALEPFANFNADIRFEMDYTKRHNEFFKVDESDKYYQHLSRLDNGSFGISFGMLKSSFVNAYEQEIIDGDTISYPVLFRRFEDYRQVASERLGDLAGITDPFENSDTIYTDYRAGYGPYSQEVLIPAFIAAYTGQDASYLRTSKLNFYNILSRIPRPNWRITYNGLAQIPALSGIFKTFRLNHAYNSKLQINRFQSNWEYEFNYYDFQEEQAYNNYTGNFIESINGEYLKLGNQVDELTSNNLAYYQIPDITLSEQFAPLLGIDMGFQFGATAKFEYRRSRNVGLSLQSFQVSENFTRDITFGAGYRLTGISIPLFTVNGQKIVLENDINFSLDHSNRKSLITLFLLDQDIYADAGGNTVSIWDANIDYQVNDQLQTGFYFKHSKTIPAVSTAFPITTMEGGIKLNFSLTQ